MCAVAAELTSSVARSFHGHQPIFHARQVYVKLPDRDKGQQAHELYFLYRASLKSKSSAGCWKLTDKEGDIEYGRCRFKMVHRDGGQELSCSAEDPTDQDATWIYWDDEAQAEPSPDDAVGSTHEAGVEASGRVTEGQGLENPTNGAWLEEPGLVVEFEEEEGCAPDSRLPGC